MDVMGVMDGGRVFVLLSALSNHCRACLDLGVFPSLLEPLRQVPVGSCVTCSALRDNTSVQQPIYLATS